jgi:hypothetical protein
MNNFAHECIAIAICMFNTVGVTSIETPVSHGGPRGSIGLATIASISSAFRTCLKRCAFICESNVGLTNEATNTKIWNLELAHQSQHYQVCQPLRRCCRRCSRCWPGCFSVLEATCKGVGENMHTIEQVYGIMRNMWNTERCKAKSHP